MNHAKDQFAKHLASLGFELSAPREVILDKLRQRLGEQRFKEFQTRRAQSTASQEEFYTQFQDIVEGNLMRSLDTCATLDASYSLYEKCMSWIDTGSRLTELGCWTGGLASFIAARHPDCSVVGVDFARKVIEACTAHYRLPNLGFRQWNYRWGKPEDLEPADLLLCSMGVVHHAPDNGKQPDPAAIRRSKEYLVQRDHAIGYFSVWRSAAKDDAMLFAILRLRLFQRFLAWMDAAQQTGWTPMLDRLWHADLSGEKAALPGLVFKANPCDPLPLDFILDRWDWFDRRSHFYSCLTGGSALAAFQAFSQRKVLAVRDYYHDRLSTRDEIGLAGGAGYVFTNDALSRFRLLLVSQHRAAELSAAIQDSNVPIGDEATLGSAAADRSVFATGNTITVAPATRLG